MMKINHLVILILLLSLICLFQCRESSNPNEGNISIDYVSIENGDSLNPGAGLLIRFSAPIDLSSFAAQQIQTSFDITYIDSSGLQNYPIDLQIYKIESAGNVLLNGNPLSFWYDPVHYEIALFEETTVQMPFGTGEGFSIGQDSIELIVKGEITSENGMNLVEDFNFTFYRAGSSYQLRAVPNPAFPAISQQGIQYPRVNFLHLPASCLIHIYDHSNIQIRTLQHQSGGAEMWDLTKEDSTFIDPGIYQFELQVNSVIVDGGVFVFPAIE